MENLETVCFKFVRELHLAVVGVLGTDSVLKSLLESPIFDSVWCNGKVKFIKNSELRETLQSSNMQLYMQQLACVNAALEVKKKELFSGQRCDR